MEIISSFFSNLHFIRPQVLYVLPIVLAIVWFLQRKQKGGDSWEKVCDEHLLAEIKSKSAEKGSGWMKLLWLISILAVLAISGPSFRKIPTPVMKNQSALVVALDVSKSMLSDDIKPNRLERAKYKLNDILEKRKDGQTALLVYAGDAFIVTPLTDDTETISLLVKAISPEIMPVQGSRADIALLKAKDLLQQAGYSRGEIILMTDGVNLDSAMNVAEDLADEKINTSVLAIGTEAGAPIPTQQGFVKDRSGNIVVPKLDISELRQLSSAGNGRFSQLTGDSADIDFLVPTDAEKNDDEATDNSELDSEKYIDEGPWLVLAILPLFVLLFRKGLLLSLFLVAGLQTPQISQAFEWKDLWLNSDQQAAEYINNENPQKAFEKAKSDSWKATAAYKKGDFQSAGNLFNDGSADGLYNQGNALAQSGKLQEALDAYNQSLELRPDDEDTLYNKKQVEEALKQQQQEQQQNQDNQQQDSEDQQQNQDDQQQEQENQDQENQDAQENSEQQQQEGQQNQDSQDNPEQQGQKSEQDEMTEEEKRQQEQVQKELEEADKEQQEPKEQQAQVSPEELQEKAENKEAIEQWLRRIPDDPGGLLRRKFYYQYNQQKNKPDEQQDW